MSDPKPPTPKSVTAAHALETQLLAAWPLANWGRLHVVAAVSGGADSVALLRALHGVSQQPQYLTVAHVQHNLRVEAADDARFVQSLAGELGCRFEQVEVDVATAAQARGDGAEEAARALRYRGLSEIAHRCGARYVATAHTADDQVETVLHRILRGSSALGLGGIPRYRPLSEAVTLVRPLLAVSRATVLDYLAHLRQAYCDDITNNDARYTRNRIRHELLPQLETTYNPALREALLRLATSAEELAAFVQPHVEKLYAAAVGAAEPSGVLLAGHAMRDAEPLLRREVLKRVWTQQQWPQQQMTRQHWERVAALLDDSTSDTACDLPGGVSARRTAEGDLRLWKCVASG